MITDAKRDELLGAFPFGGTFVETEELTEGHINNTYVFTFIENGKTVKYLIQRINTYVFKDPAGLMENMVGVTEHLQKAVAARGGDVTREALRVFPAKDGKPYYVGKENGYWRCLNFITDSHSLQTITDPKAFYNSARAFGTFQCLLADYPIETLRETIPNFHNTVSRIADFKASLQKNASGRADTAKAEAQFVLDRESDCGILLDLAAKGELPLRVTHNDTKLNNVMFDNTTNEGICVVDLDTVMPGLSLYDFGDSIRFGANTAAEDEKDVSKVSLSLPYFEAYTKGYLSAAGKALTKAEIDYLPHAARIMTLECGMRFLADYFDGDVYFHTAYPEHNLVRSRTQFALVADMEQKFTEMQQIVADCCAELGL